VQTLLTYVFGLLLVGGLLFLAASFAFGRGEEMAPALPEGTPVELPDDRPAAGSDLRALRLSVVLRGYRMDEVDWVLDRLAEQVDSRDREIARLRSVLHVEPVGVGARTDTAARDNGSHVVAEPALLTHPAAPLPVAMDGAPGGPAGGDGPRPRPEAGPDEAADPPDAAYLDDPLAALPDPAYLDDPAEAPVWSQPAAGGGREPAADLPDAAYLDDPAEAPVWSQPAAGGGREPAADLPDPAYLDDPAEAPEPPVEPGPPATGRP